MARAFQGQPTAAAPAAPATPKPAPAKAAAPAAPKKAAPKPVSTTAPSSVYTPSAEHSKTLEGIRRAHEVRNQRLRNEAELDEEVLKRLGQVRELRRQQVIGPVSLGRAGTKYLSDKPIRSPVGKVRQGWFNLRTPEAASGVALITPAGPPVSPTEEQLSNQAATKDQVKDLAWEYLSAKREHDSLRDKIRKIERGLRGAEEQAAAYGEADRTEDQLTEQGRAEGARKLLTPLAREARAKLQRVAQLRNSLSEFGWVDDEETLNATLERLMK